MRCYRDQQTFEDVFERRFGASARPRHRVLRRRSRHPSTPTTCANVHLFFDGLNTVRTAGAYAILLHESLHRQGLRNERLTTCFANDAVRWGTGWYGGSKQGPESPQPRVHLHPDLRAALVPDSKPNCLALTTRFEWVAYA